MSRTLIIAFVAAQVAATAAGAQGSGDVGSLWRKSAPASVKPAKADSSKKVASSDAKKDSAKTVAPADAKNDSAKTVAPVYAAANAKPVSAVRDSVPVRVRVDSVFVVRIKPETVVVAAPHNASDVTPAMFATVKSRLDSLQAAQAAAAKQAAAAEKTVAQKLAGLGNFKFTGDVRVRYEGQFQGGDFVTRHRERSRARFGITANLGDDVVGTIGVATGALDDVQSTNQTQTGFFSRKTIGFDKLFVTWKPSAVKGLSVTAGKFPYTWERTALTLGNDINPEGASSSYTVATTGTLESVTLTAFALPFLEVGSGTDSYIAGGQVQTRWKLAPKFAARLSYASVAFHGADAIAQAFTAGTIKPSSANTNSVRTDSAGKVIGYKNGFGYADVVAVLEYVPRAKWPVTLLVDGMRNQKAAPGQRAGLYTDLRAGRLAQRKDIQVAWSFFRIERDAVIGALNEQDLRAATNVMNHRGGVSYQWRSNTVLNLGVWYGKLIDPALTGKLATPGFKSACTTSPFTGCRDPWLSRVQLDLSYRF